MKLISLLEKLEYTCLQGSTDQEVKNVIYDSRKVEEGSLFICIRGAVVDGHKFVPDVVAKGAKVLIVEEAVEAPEDVTVILVKDTRYAMAFISAAYFGYPAEKLKTIGITGTKGKTTTTYMVKSILENAGYKVGLIGTIEAIIGDKVIPAKNTTPESYVIQEYFHEMAEAGCDCVVMEVSSQGLMLHRTQGFVFDFGIFTNIEPDHIHSNDIKAFHYYAPKEKHHNADTSSHVHRTGRIQNLRILFCSEKALPVLFSQTGLSSFAGVLCSVQTCFLLLIPHAGLR